MTNFEGMTKPKIESKIDISFWHSSFVIVSSFVIRHSSFSHGFL